MMETPYLKIYSYKCSERTVTCKGKYHKPQPTRLSKTGIPFQDRAMQEPLHNASSTPFRLGAQLHNGVLKRLGAASHNSAAFVLVMPLPRFTISFFPPDDNDECGAFICNCDRVAAHCFAASPYNNNNYNIDLKARCQ
ncbi:hypothetical protein L345_18206, partial [Ophiophagus hannah]